MHAKLDLPGPDFHTLFFVAAQAEPPVLHQAGLQALMRLQASDAVGCTRLLTAEGYIGCAGLHPSLLVGIVVTAVSA